MYYLNKELQPKLTKVVLTKFSGPKAVRPKNDIFINFFIETKIY